MQTLQHIHKREVNEFLRPQAIAEVIRKKIKGDWNKSYIMGTKKSVLGQAVGKGGGGRKGPVAANSQKRYKDWKEAIYVFTVLIPTGEVVDLGIPVGSGNQPPSDDAKGWLRHWIQHTVVTGGLRK